MTFDRVLPKKRRRTEVAVAEYGSLIPSAGTIFNLQSQIASLSPEPRAPAFAASVLGGHAMKISRLQFLHLAAGAAALPAVSRIAWAQTYPTRPVHIIVGFPPGGMTDTTARLMGQWLSERLGQPFIIENRPGATDNIATEAVARAPPDGHTLLMTLTVNAINATLYDKLNFNFIRDIAPVASINRAPHVIDVNPSVPARTVPEFIALAKANPGKLNMGSGGIGSNQHVSGELFKMMTGINLVHVPYRGGAPAIADLLGGQVQVIFDVLSESIGYIRAGKLRPLAVTTAVRSEALPDLPTVADFVPGYETSAWYGVGAPRNTPAAIIDKLNKEINSGLADPRIKARFADLGAAVFTRSPTDFGKFISEELLAKLQ
jgi:tripartite-type tricarboxylate transporter receptor subunit TctC